MWKTLGSIREAEEAVVEHLLEELGVAEERGGGCGVAIVVGWSGYDCTAARRSGRGGWAGSNGAGRRWPGAQPHRGVDLGGEAIPEGAEEGVEVRGFGLVRIVGVEDLAEERLDQGDLDQGRGRGAAAGDRGGESRSARTSWPRAIGCDQPGRLAQAVSRPGARAGRAPGARVSVDGLAKRFDEPGRAGRPGRVAPRQVRQLVREDGAELAMGQDPEQRQARGSRPATRPQATTPQHGKYVSRI